jgi:peptidylprolyl isomerase
MKTKSGLEYVETQAGTGSQAKAGDLVRVHYTGKFLDGKVFDSSVSRGEPLEFPLGKGRVIKGWDEGIALMNVGGKATLTIPPQLAYGESGAGGVIPPNATLIFDVELVGIQ